MTSRVTRRPQRHGSLPSCDICRHRRVACERPDPTGDCLKCAAKGIRCTTTNPQRRTHVRAGTRIQEAKEKYGSNEPQDELVAIDSPDSRALARELAALLGAHLVGVYLDKPKNGLLMDKAHLLLPIMKWADFERRFEVSGRRPSDMDPEDELICNIIIATAANITDHPCILGPSAPSLQALRQMPLSKRCELDQYGIARQKACRSLADRAQRLSDERGLWRSPSPGGVTALLLLEQLVSDGQINCNEGRPYLCAAIEQLRQLELDRSRPPVFIDGGLGWAIMLKDALGAAEAGRELIASDQDCTTLLRSAISVHTLPSAENIRVALVSNTGKWGPVLPVWHAVLMVARDVVKRLTGPAPRTAPIVDLIFVRHAWLRLDEISRWVRGAVNVRSEREWRASHYFEVYLGLIWLSCTCLEFIIFDVLRERLAARTVPGVTAASVTDSQALFLVLVESKTRVERSLLEFFTLVKSGSGIDPLVLGTGTFWSVNRLHGLAELLVAMQISTHNPIQSKLVLIDSLLDTVGNVSWTWPVLGQTIALLQSERDRLIAQVYAYTTVPIMSATPVSERWELESGAQSTQSDLWMNQFLALGMQ